MKHRSSAIARSVAAVLMVAALPALESTVLSTAASAAPACTIVGTSGSDRLVGTPRRDVICGRGGNDTLIGRGGDDILIGGSGRDRLVGGAGNDRLLGGSSPDVLEGGDGADTLAGDGGSDRLVGGSGNDRLVGGTSGDVLEGGSGADVVLGEGGSDRLSGGTGNDRLLGGDLNDTIEGGDGTDDLLGGAGNDDLIGGPKSDDIDGGTGTNWCLLDAADEANRCVYDQEAAVAHEVTVSQPSVDVTLADRTVTVRVHVTDDTGARSVRIAPGAETPWFPDTHAALSSGTVRNGWWTATLTLRRWSVPAAYAPQVTVWDRLNRRTDTGFPGSSIEVLNATPDTEQPEVTLLDPDPDTTYDVRTARAVVPFRMRIVDPVSGVGAVSVALWAPRIDGAMSQGYGAYARLTSGTTRDGIWTGTVEIPKGGVGGDWNLWVGVNDRARTGSSNRLNYWGPGEFLGREGDPAVDRAFPHGMGSINVIGRLRTDNAPPVISSAVLTPDTVDTLPGPAMVNVSVQATDNDSGVDGIHAELVPATNDGSQPTYISTNPGLSSGTVTNGTWTGTITLPQGLPPGTYYLKIIIWDSESNMTAYIASGHPGAGSWSNQLSGNPTVTVVDSSP